MFFLVLSIIVCVNSVKAIDDNFVYHKFANADLGDDLFVVRPTRSVTENPKPTLNDSGNKKTFEDFATKLKVLQNSLKNVQSASKSKFFHLFFGIGIFQSIGDFCHYSRNLREVNDDDSKT